MTAHHQIQIQGLQEDIVRIKAPEAPELADECFVDERRPRRFVVHTDYGVVDVFQFNRLGPGWLVVHEVVSGSLVNVTMGDAGVQLEGPIVDVECWDHWPPQDDEVHHALEDHLDYLRGKPLMTAYRAARTAALSDARKPLVTLSPVQMPERVVETAIAPTSIAEAVGVFADSIEPAPGSGSSDTKTEPEAAA